MYSIIRSHSTLDENQNRSGVGSSERITELLCGRRIVYRNCKDDTAEDGLKSDEAPAPLESVP